MGNIYMAEAYSINQFYDKALHHLDLAYKILEKDKSKNSKIFFAKANVLNSYANVYSDKGEPRKAVKKLYQVIDSYNELDDPKEVKRFQYLNYSNIASLYLFYNIDSADYFAKKSVALGSSNNMEDKVMISNYQVFGKVNKQKKEYEKSLYYYHKALKLSNKIGEQLNINNIYKDIADLYKVTGKHDSAIIYENKLKQHEISELQSKYNSLHEVIYKDQKEESKSKAVNNIVLILVVAVFFIVLIWSILSIKRRRANKEEPHEAYNKLLNLIKENDPAFMFSFEKTYPHFSDKLLKINPQLSNSKIEFCAFLKLKLSTKEIAKITFIEPRTVQNKKYRIRKRLNIPSTADIYNWFDSI
jgi:tetratricopeptide (TPR) repeat protein